MSATRPFTLAILGCGAVVHEFHAPALAALAAAVEVRLCVDVEPAAADAAAHRLGGRAVAGGLDELLAAEPTDGVLVALPNDHHATAAGACLLAGRHVLCEKPAATDAADRERLEAAVARTDRVLTLNLLRRFLPAVPALLDVAGELAPLERVDVDEGGAGWPSRSGFQFVAERARGGVTLDRGPHVFDTLIGLVGAPSVDDYVDDADGGVEATSITELSWPGGMRGSVRISKLEPWPRSATITAADSRVAVWSLFDPATIRILDATGAEIERRSVEPSDDRLGPMIAAQREAIEAWIAACRGQRANPTPFEDVRAGCLVIEACYACRRPLELSWHGFDG